MYEAFYGLRDKPFSMLPDPGFLYLSKQHQAALTLLEYGLMNHVGFCVISGETGAGKTTLLRKLLERIDGSYTVGMITNTHQSFGSLLDWVLSAFNIHDSGLSQVEMHQKLMDFLIAEYAKNKKVLLIVDEAQNMKAETLEELRMLSNVNSEKDQLVQVILAGQPALKATLKIPELMQFAQRIGVDYHLGTLNAKETCCYIQHRLVTAGAKHDVFTPAACERIHNYSGGTPRLINLLCDTVLVYGFADQQLVVDVDLVEEMVQERMKDSVVPLVNRDVPKNSPQALAELECDFPWIAPADGRGEIKQNVTVATVDGSQLDENAPDKNLPDEKRQSVATKPHAVTDKIINNVGSGRDNTRTTENNQRVPANENVEVVAGKKSVINTIETIVPERVEKSANKWWVYTFIAMGLIVIAFFLYKSDLLPGASPPEQALKNSSSDVLQLDQAQQKFAQEKKKLKQQADLLREKNQALLKLAAERKRAESVAAEVETALKAAALEKAEKLAVAAKKERQRLAKQKALKAKQRAQRQAWLAKLAAKKAAAKKRVVIRAVEEQRRIKAQLKEQQRLKRIEQTRQLKKTEREKQLQALQQAKTAVVTETAEAVAEKKTKKIIDLTCTGPTARFKSTCR